MILTEAKKRAQREFDEALERTGLTRGDGARVPGRAPRDEARDLPRPAPARAAGTAAKTILDIAERSGHRVAPAAAAATA